MPNPTTPDAAAAKQAAPMNQYEILNAGHVVDGYFISRPAENEQTTFDRAKTEAIEHLTRRLENVRNITLTQFKSSGFQCS